MKRESVMCQRRQNSWKLLERYGRAVVLREGEAHQQRDPDRHVGIAAEVAVDLDRVGVQGEPGVGRGERAGDGEDGVHDLARQEVGDADLLDQPERDQPAGGAERDVARVARGRELGQELACADDRPGHQVGEEAEVDGDVDRA